jgi:hypothetical protein
VSGIHEAVSPDQKMSGNRRDEPPKPLNGIQA